MFAAVTIFLGTYVLLSFEQNIPGLHISRSAAALLGAVAMVALGVLRLDQAYRLVDLNTIVFLLGMMIVVGYLEITGFFAEVEILLLKRARTTREFLGLVVFSSGVLSALFMNDTICIMLTPVLMRLVLRARLNPNPYLVALAISSNIGSVMTPMGNPQNMIVAIHAAIPFSQFILVLAPIAALGLILNYFVLCRLYPEEFAPGRGLNLHEPHPPHVRVRLLYVCLAGVGLMLILFAMDVSPPLAAISVAALLILAGATQPRDAFRYVNWELLLMFSGLFVVMGGLRQAGVIEVLFDLTHPVVSASLAARIGAVSAASAAVSNLVSNVPCVIFFSNLLPRIGEHPALWLALAMSSTIAGNLTIIGSVANLIVFESAKGSARVGFWEYFRAGAPMTILLIIIGTIYLAAIFH
ncbi:MAG: anion transporter [Elusimicrobia bacterium]|nr:anion transporter [Elusimicrobiota bacterium]